MDWWLDDRRPCVGTPLSLWFGDADEDGPEDRKTYRARLEACPVWDSCLADALAAERGSGPQHRFGVRGGYTPRERAELDARPRAA